MIEINTMPGGRAVATLAIICGLSAGFGAASPAVAQSAARILQGQDHHHRARASARRLLRFVRSARRRSSEAIHPGQSEHHRAASAWRRRRRGGALVPRAGAARRHHDRPVRRDHRPHAVAHAGARPVEGRGDDLYRHVHAEQCRLRDPQERARDHRRRHAQDARSRSPAPASIRRATSIPRRSRSSAASSSSSSAAIPARPRSCSRSTAPRPTCSRAPGTSGARRSRPASRTAA